MINSFKQASLMIIASATAILPPFITQAYEPTDAVFIGYINGVTSTCERNNFDIPDRLLDASRIGDYFMKLNDMEHLALIIGQKSGQSDARYNDCEDLINDSLKILDDLDGIKEFQW